MTWSWSHSDQGVATVRRNLSRLSRERLNEIYAEWKAGEGGHFPRRVRVTDAPFNDRRYARALSAAAYLDTDTLIERIWEWCERQANCTNGGHYAWCCPYGCEVHMVGFSDDRLPSWRAVRRELRAIHDAIDHAEDCDEPLEVRLQVQDDGTWRVHHGDPGFDQDHHGYWGSASLSRSEYISDRELRDVAEELVCEVEEAMALDDCD